MVNKRTTPAQLMMAAPRGFLPLENQHASRVPAYATFVRTRQSHGESISGTSLLSARCLGEQTESARRSPYSASAESLDYWRSRHPPPRTFLSINDVVNCLGLVFQTFSD